MRACVSAIVLLVLMTGSVAAAVDGSAWARTREVYEIDPDYSVFGVERTDSSNSGTLRIERVEAHDYGGDYFVKAVVSFGEPLTEKLATVHGNRTAMPATWSVDEQDPVTTNGWWIAGKVAFRVSTAEFELWRKASALKLSIDSDVGKLTSTFALDGLGPAFAGVEVQAPTVPVEARIPVAGLQGVSHPVLIPSSKVDPTYPNEAMEKRINGSVILLAVVRADGSVDKIFVIRCDKPGLGFERAAKEAVRQWRYKPALRGGRPVDVRLTVIVDFSLR